MEANEEPQIGTENHTEISDERVLSLYLAAMTRPAAERSQFVAEACSGDHQLLSQVQRRVDWELRMKGFLLTPAFNRERMDHPFSTGEIILRRFEILRLAGEGGMGIVYEALDQKLNQRIAIKCSRFEFRSRLSPEVIHALRVTHPNVCRVFELHTAETKMGEVDFLTMEFLAGQTLAERLTQEPAGWLLRPEGRTIALQLCAGLAAVHAQGLVHRDLKPTNVMLSRDAEGGTRAVIMDFGIAQEGDAFVTQMRGSPAYVAPELWKARSASVQSDIYALGVLLYEMASGRKPFAENSSWRERLGSVPAAPTVAEPYRSAILRCLHPDPTKRFPRVAELENALLGNTRRVVLGASAVGLLGSLGLGGRALLYPSSPVRLAILPPSFQGSASENRLLQGFSSDLWYRLKALRNTRRPCTVFPPNESAKEDIASPQQASRLGATHALQLRLRRSAARWEIRAELSPVSAWSPWGTQQRTATDSNLAGLLFAFQPEALQLAVSGLALDSTPARNPLPAAAQEDYLRGLYFVRYEFEDAAPAIPCFERVIAAAPDMPEGYAGLAEALLRVRGRNYDKSLDGRAVAALSRAEQLDPDSAHVRLIAARLNGLSGFYDPALADAQRAAQLAPQDPEPLVSTGLLLYLLRRPEDAEKAFQAAIALQPEYYKTYIDTGLFYYERRNFPKAEQYWREAVRLAPGHTRARLNLAALFQNSGRLKEAEEQANACLKLKQSSDLVELLGDLHLAAGRNREAVSSYEESLQMRPDHYKSWASLGRAYRAAGREIDAANAFRRGLTVCEEGLRTNPLEVERIAWTAFYHALLGEEDAARGRAGEALAMNSAQGNVRKRLVLTYALLNDVVTALKLLESAPPYLVVDLDHSPELSSALRQDPKYQQLKR